MPKEISFISEEEAHRKIVEKNYDDNCNYLSLDYLDEYGLRYLADHVYALVSYRDPKRTNWYLKLLQLAKGSEFEQKQLEYFPFETDLPLKTTKRAFEASLEKEDAVRSVELLLLNSAKVIHIIKESPLSVLNDLYKDASNSKNNYILEKAWRVADLYDKEARIRWYLVIAWYLDYKNDIHASIKTLDTLFRKELVYVNNGYIINHLVYFLYPRYKDSIVKIFDYLPNDDIYIICSLFIKNKNNLETVLEIFRYIKNKKENTNGKTNLEVCPSDKVL